MAFVPVMTWIANKRDRKTALIIAFSVEIIGLLGMKLAGLTSLPLVIILAVFAGIGLSGFWTMFYSLAYDLCEIDEYLNNKRREGTMTALPQLVQKIGSAIGLWEEFSTEGLEFLD